MMFEFASIIIVAALIAFPIVYSQSNNVIRFEFIVGLVFGVNFNSVEFEHTEEEDKYYKQYMFQFHLLFLTTTMSFIREKTFKA